MPSPREPDADGGSDGERVPLGTWPRLYGAVIATALLAMALCAVFSAWRY